MQQLRSLWQAQRTQALARPLKTNKVPLPPPLPPVTSQLPPFKPIHKQRLSSFKVAEVETIRVSPLELQVGQKKRTGQLAHQFVDGQLAKWCEKNPEVAPPVAVMIHGIMGSGKNMLSMAKRLTQEFPGWRVLLVDLRCHGESAADSTGFHPPHTVESCGQDVLQLLNSLKVFPHVVIGHSFGGKVALAMASQFGEVLPRPVHMWIWDCLPGNIRVGRQDHPEDVINTLRSINLPIPSRRFVLDQMKQRGFSEQISQWCTTNLKPFNVYGSGGGFVWNLDLMGIADLWASYASTNLWNVVSQPPQGLRLDFVRAERNYFKWDGGDAERIQSYGHQVHMLEKSGHFVHVDNPQGLMDIIKPTFCFADQGSIEM